MVFGGFSSTNFYKELIQYPEVDYVMRGNSTEEPLRQLMDCIRHGFKPDKVPNLAWKDGKGKVRENPFSHIPTDLSHLMVSNYAETVRSVIRYRDLASYAPFKGWKDYPIIAVLTCKGCKENCVICGGSAAAFRKCYGRERPVFRSPEAVIRNVRQIEKFSTGPIFILGDLLQPGEDYAEEVLRGLEGVNNQLILELFNPAPPGFIKRMGQACTTSAWRFPPNPTTP